MSAAITINKTTVNTNNSVSKTYHLKPKHTYYALHHIICIVTGHMRRRRSKKNQPKTPIQIYLRVGILKSIQIVYRSILKANAWTSVLSPLKCDWIMLTVISVIGCDKRINFRDGESWLWIRIMQVYCYFYWVCFFIIYLCWFGNGMKWCLVAVEIIRCIVASALLWI